MAPLWGLPLPPLSPAPCSGFLCLWNEALSPAENEQGCLISPPHPWLQGSSSLNSSRPPQELPTTDDKHGVPITKQTLDSVQRGLDLRSLNWARDLHCQVSPRDSNAR